MKDGHNIKQRTDAPILATADENGQAELFAKAPAKKCFFCGRPLPHGERDKRRCDEIQNDI